MFQPAPAARFRARFFGASVLIHIAGILLLLGLRLSDAQATFRSPPLRVAMIAPRLAPYRQPTVRRLALKAPLPPIPRVFRLAARPQPEAPPSPLLIAPPAVELRQNTPPPDVAQPPLPSPLPAPVRTGTFVEAQAAPVTPKASLPRANVFSDALAPAGLPLVSAASPPPASAGFGDATVAAVAMPSHPNAAPANITPVEILAKPRPVYTEEARRLSVEGEVLVEVLFQASGQTSVQRLVRGLGHGLDENAMSAARLIRFRPARQGGNAVDSLAVVHVLFQLAY